MNIKSLLLGSAAALAAVSGARAADAVVIAEPEPMEYVRVCDTYGVGFYYIPGTETCLKVSGYVRYDIGIGARGFQDVIDKQDLRDAIAEQDEDLFGTNDTYRKRARFALRVDARSETELGTLRAYAQINFDWNSNNSGATIFGYGVNFFGYGGWTGTDTGISINHAYIELGGFRIGKTDSLFSTFTGYASGVINDGLVAYGPFDTHQIAYTWNGGNGFSAAVALEEGSGSSFNFATPQTPVPIFYLDAYTIDSYVPHVVGGVGYTGGWGGVSGVVGYDSVWDEFAIKGRIDVNAMDALSLFLMAAWDSSDDGAGYNFYAPWGGEWAVWFGGAYKFNEKTNFNFEIGYDEAEDFSVAANVDYELVPNLRVIPEITYQDNFDTDYDDNWGGTLRLQANFGG